MSRLAPTVIAATALAATLATPSLAEARGLHVRVGGGVHVHGGVVVRVGPPPPPAVVYTYETYPVYPSYPTYYAPAPAIVAPVEPRRPIFGLGVLASSISINDSEYEGEGVGLMGRLRLTPRFQLELQLSQDRFFDHPRIDSRFGGAGLFMLGQPGGLTPYVLVGAGVNVIQPNGDEAQIETQRLPTQGYLEAGVGLEWELFTHLVLSGDLRVQARRLDRDSADAYASAKLSPTPSGTWIPDKEDAVEGRVNLILYF
jgi:hypothetical protein